MSRSFFLLATEAKKFKFLSSPEEFTGDSSGLVKSLKCLECKLGRPDASARPSPVPVKGSDFKLRCDLAIIAIGLSANRVLTKVTPGLKTDKYGNVVVDASTMQTSLNKVFAGGDIVGGEGTVIEAMGMGKRAAESIIAGLGRFA